MLSRCLLCFCFFFWFSLPVHRKISNNYFYGSVVDPQGLTDAALSDPYAWDVTKNCFGFFAPMSNDQLNKRDAAECASFCTDPSVPSNETSLCRKSCSVCCVSHIVVWKYESHCIVLALYSIHCLAFPLYTEDGRVQLELSDGSCPCPLLLCSAQWALSKASLREPPPCRSLGRAVQRAQSYPWDSK